MSFIYSNNNTITSKWKIYSAGSNMTTTKMYSSKNNNKKKANSKKDWLMQTSSAEFFDQSKPRNGSVFLWIHTQKTTTKQIFHRLSAPYYSAVIPLNLASTIHYKLYINFSIVHDKYFEYVNHLKLCSFVYFSL